MPNYNKLTKLIIMKRKILYLTFLLTVISLNCFSQEKEKGKLNDYIQKGQLEKAEKYYLKLEKSYTKNDFFELTSILGIAFLNSGDIYKANELASKQIDIEFATKMAEYYFTKKDIRKKDSLKSAYFYGKAKNIHKAVQIYLSLNNQYSALSLCPNDKLKKIFGDSLLNAGDIDNAYYFYKKTSLWRRSRMNSSKQENDKINIKELVVSEYLKKKDYATAYQITNEEQSEFLQDQQGIVIIKMADNDEPLDSIINLTEDIGLSKEKQVETIVHACLETNKYEKAYEYLRSFSKEDTKNIIDILYESTRNYSKGDYPWRASINKDIYLLCAEALTSIDNKDEAEFFICKYIQDVVYSFASVYTQTKQQYILSQKKFKETIHPNIERFGYYYSDYCVFLIDVILTKSLESMQEYTKNPNTHIEKIFKSFDYANLVNLYVSDNLRIYCEEKEITNNKLIENLDL